MADFPETVTILGVGLIGASLGRGLIARTGVRRVVGWGRNSEKLARAVELKAITDGTTVLADAVRDADLVVVCTPVGMIPELVREAAQHARPGTLLTDAGSTKAGLAREIERMELKNACRFLGAHPVAGKEDHSLEASDGGLFDGRLTVLTPVEDTPAEDVRQLTAFWQAVGSRVECMPPETHDAVLARTSHVPHALACVLAKIVPPELFPYAGTGYATTSRLARGSVDVWRDILLENANAVQNVLQDAAAELHALQAALQASDAGALERFLDAAKRNRDAFPHA